MRVPRLRRRQAGVLRLGCALRSCEKKLEIDFLPTADLRNISRQAWDSILDAAKCSIVSSTKNDAFVSYVLSESSLFVYPHRVSAFRTAPLPQCGMLKCYSSQIIIKTCGTTTLLNCIALLLQEAKTLGTEPEFVQFSRSHFIFPDRQPVQHRSFNAEVKILDGFFPGGSAYILGPLNGPRFHVYVCDLQPSSDTADQRLEMIMFDLDEAKMRQFYNAAGGQARPGETLPSTGLEATRMSGIDTILPGAVVDDFLFSPCGYSCNGLREDAFFTIHVTPEPTHSFVSFETNVKASEYNAVVARVLDIFRPRNFTISVFVDMHAVATPLTVLNWNIPGYAARVLVSPR